MARQRKENCPQARDPSQKIKRNSFYSSAKRKRLDQENGKVDASQKG